MISSRRTTKRDSCSRTLGAPHFIRLALPLLLSLAAGAVVAEEPLPDWVTEARQGAQALGGQLKQTLTDTVQRDGPVAATDVCQLQAPTITRHLIQRQPASRQSLAPCSQPEQCPVSAVPLCLACHGHTPDPELQQAIERRYPQDQARGFSEGELRGAFSVRVLLPR